MQAWTVTEGAGWAARPRRGRRPSRPLVTGQRPLFYRRGDLFRGRRAGRQDELQADAAQHPEDGHRDGRRVGVRPDRPLADPVLYLVGEDLAEPGVPFGEQGAQGRPGPDGFGPQQQESLPGGREPLQLNQVGLDGEQEQIKSGGLGGRHGKRCLGVEYDRPQQTFFGAELVGDDAPAVAGFPPDFLQGKRP